MCINNQDGFQLLQHSSLPSSTHQQKQQQTHTQQHNSYSTNTSTTSTMGLELYQMPAPEVEAANTLQNARLLRYIEYLADTRKNPAAEPQMTPVLHTAAELARLVREASLGAIHREHEAITEFVAKFREYIDLGSRGRLEERDIEDMIGDFIERLDKLFFFGMLTREVVNQIGNRTPLVDVVTINGRGYDFYSFEDNRMTIYYGEGPGWESDPPVNYQNTICTRILTVVLPQMVHAYLEIFADPDDVNYRAHVELPENTAGEGCGYMFWTILAFITAKVHTWTASARIEAIAKEQFEDMHELLDENGHTACFPTCPYDGRYGICYYRYPGPLE
ncbi:hypothetical protein GGS20DRAFT_547148 [Poronia punctata]|nr:hypothetical protein GGS20DRAFT_547148 [Poronia punctata]